MKVFSFTMVSLFQLSTQVLAENEPEALQKADLLVKEVFKSVLQHQYKVTAWVNIIQEDATRFSADAFLTFANVRMVKAEDEEDAHTKIMDFFNNEYALVKNHLVADKPTIVIRGLTDYARIKDTGLFSI